MFFLRFLFGGLFALALLGFLLKSLLLVWVPQAFASLSFGEQFYALAWGLRFDLAAATMLFTPVAVTTYAFQRMRLLSRLSLRWIWLPASVMIGMHLADLMYFAHSGRHVGYEIRELIPEFAGLMGTALNLYLPLLIGFVLVCLVGWRLCRRHWPVQPPGFFSLEAPLALWILVAVLLIRGSVFDIPMKPDRAYAIGDEQQALLALNPAYGMLSNLFEKNTAASVYLVTPAPSLDVLKSHLAPFFNGADQHYRPPHKGMNVILMMLESWPAELVRSYNSDAPEATPALDALQRRGVSTDGLIAGGSRTTEGFFSALCSFQNPLGQAVPHTRLESYPYRCLPALLRESGWHVAVFQGTHSGTTGQLSQRLGAESSFGKLDMPPPTIPQNSWGYHDPDLYRFVLDKARAETRPFFYIINNATTHDLTLPPGEPWVFGRDTEEQRRISLLNYADSALQRFIADYEAAGLGPTLFVITADHTAGRRISRFSYFWIPFSMFATDGSVPDVHKPGIGSQRDIAPTILDVLGGHAPWFTGRSLFSSDPGGGEYFANGIQGWIRGNRLVEYPIHDPEDVRCYDWRGDMRMQSALECTRDDLEQRDFIRAFTWYSQSLLFSGKTAEFGRKPPRDVLPGPAGQHVNARHAGRLHPGLSLAGE